MKIFEYEVEIFKNKTEKDFFKVTEHGTVAENERYLILDDPHFTRLCKEKDRHGLDRSLDKASIYQRKWSNLPEYDGIVYQLYSAKPQKPEKIKQAIADFIAKEFGYFATINLDFIK